MCAFLAEQIVNVLLPIEFGCDRKRDFFFFTFRTNRDTIEEIENVFVSRFKI